MAKPLGWPPQIRYTISPCFHSSVTSNVRSFIQGSSPGKGKLEEEKSQKSLVLIRLITDPSHPTSGQHGLFAAKKIPPGIRIIDYIGEVHCDDRLDSDYDLSLHRTTDGANVGIDASTMGNEARFVNDYRGIRDRPNAVFGERRTASGELRMSVYSGSEVIRKGEEILVSYGKSWWQARTVDEP